jgi:hypothetical protein
MSLNRARAASRSSSTAAATARDRRADRCHQRFFVVAAADDVLDDRVVVVVEHDIFLGREVAVERGGRDLRRVGDLLDGDSSSRHRRCGDCFRTAAVH